MKCMVGGASMSMKRVWAAEEEVECAGLSQWGDDNPLFLESGSEDGAEVRLEMAGLEIPGTEATEFTEALQAQMAMMQVQVCIEEWMCAQMEQLLSSLDQHCSSQQELLEVLHVMAWGFRHELGLGLDMWAGIAMGQVVLPRLRLKADLKPKSSGRPVES